MKKADFIQMVADKAQLTKKDANVALDAILESIEEVLIKGDNISFIGFGSFDVTKRAAREGKVPGTDKTYKSPETKVVKFKVGKKLKDAVSKAK
ncbi:HU family DNA-binding protein [Campylobacter sp. FMV-PI01]|uniref:HU family DNA-binding protein n=1 Tax=Campylobacter portucalensis TaxID=2608384 RepID=A0A6L5WGY0_9BACT|nr:HU family DNA-binding protein [Campylobacter portucalensis]MSN96289.1 HU family DNA-binding protein [Campylobacter portucalensis]